jgi:hypothetical protein
MKLSLLFVLLIPSTVAAQQSRTLSGPVSIEIRSTDTTRVSRVSIDVPTGLFGSVGVPRPAPGEVQCGPSGCIATTPAVLELALGRGEGQLTVPETSPELEITLAPHDAAQSRITSWGRTISVGRNELGHISIRATRIETRANPR